MTHARFDAAVKLMDAGDVEALKALLGEHPDLADARDDGNASLLVRLIDWPGCRPRAAETARVLVQAGVSVDARRDDQNGTALAGSLCTGEIDVAQVLVESGADVNAPLGWMPGTVFDFADRMCQGQDEQGDDNIIQLAKMFSQAAGRPVPTRAPFGGPIPLLFVRDVEAALALYTGTLGFHVNWRHEPEGCDPYISISRGNTEFHLSRCQCTESRHDGNLWVRIACDQIDDLFAEVRDSGVTIREEPADQPWGFRELEIEDADGNRFTFYGPHTGSGDAGDSV